MGDPLIRNLDKALKRELQDRAKQSGRSLSEEAMTHLRRSSLRTLDSPDQTAGEWLRGLLGDERWSEEELAAIAASRHEADRGPPSFDERTSFSTPMSYPNWRGENISSTFWLG